MAINITEPLIDVFDQLKLSEITKSMKALRSSDTVSLLNQIMRRGGRNQTPIRHVPIIASQGSYRTQGDLEALISNVELLALIAPPFDKIPNKIYEENPSLFLEVAESVKALGSQTIGVAFSSSFKLKPPQLSKDSSTVLDLLNYLINRVEDEESKLKKRFRTIPVFDKQRLIGMLSYLDVLRELYDPKRDNQNFMSRKISELLTNINQTTDTIITLEENSFLSNASSLLDGAPFTHIPLLKAGQKNSTDKIVTCMIDEAVVKTYEHELLLLAFADTPLSSLATSVSQENTIDSTKSLKELIPKFLTPERPTAILVGKWTGETFTMEGIVSYVDIIKFFKIYSTNPE
jgi:CBS domain